MAGGLAITSGLVAVGCGAVRGGYESASYRVTRSEGRFEVRDYPALTVAETAMVNPGNGSDGSFNRLFRFITGGNQANQKIAMTTPVLMSSDAKGATMAFVMPAEMKSEKVPKPSDDAVTVRELAPGRFAVLRFSGNRNEKNEAQALASLREWMRKEGLKELSPPNYGYFDPPWTPGFLRRNEVMVRVASGREH
jgi:DNA gyrase inhibitor GyrI